MYFAYRNLSKIFKGFQGYLEIPWKILENLKHSTLALIYTSLEDVHLDIALKFKVFQGQLKFSLEIFGWCSTLKILDVFRKGYLDLDWTLNFKVNFKEPWNSRLRFSSLKHTVLYQSYKNVKDGEIHDVTNFEVAEAPLSRIILADLTVKRKKICIWPITAQNWGRGHGPDFESQGKWL